MAISLVFKQSQLARRLRVRLGSRLLRGPSSGARNHLRRSVLAADAQRTHTSQSRANWSPKNPFFSRRLPFAFIRQDTSSVDAYARRKTRCMGGFQPHIQPPADWNRGAAITADHHWSPAQATRATPIAAFTTALRRGRARTSEAQTAVPLASKHSHRGETSSDTKARCSARAAATTPSANLV